MIVDFYSIFTFLSPCACDLHRSTKCNLKCNDPGTVITSYQFLDGGHGVPNLHLLRVHSLEKVIPASCLLNFDEISQFTAELLLLLVSKNKRPPYWNSTSGLQSDHICHFAMLPFIIPPSFVDM